MVRSAIGELGITTDIREVEDHACPWVKSESSHVGKAVRMFRVG